RACTGRLRPPRAPDRRGVGGAAGGRRWHSGAETARQFRVHERAPVRALALLGRQGPRRLRRLTPHPLALASRRAGRGRELVSIRANFIGRGSAGFACFWSAGVGVKVREKWGRRSLNGHKMVGKWWEPARP